MEKPPSGHRNTIRIIGGAHRSRKLLFPAAPGLRPTADRVRETLFNWLQEDIAGARCLDLFAGSGALGLEALSRAASSVAFVDNNGDATRAISASLSLLGLDNASVHRGDALQWLRDQAACGQTFDIVFLDPPFGAELLPSVTAALAASPVLGAGCKIYIETAEPLTEKELPSAWRQLKAKRAGAVNYYLYAVS